MPWYAYPRQWLNAFRMIAAIALRPRAFSPFKGAVSTMEREYATREISAVLRIPEGTVKSRLNRGRTELAKVLRKQKVLV